MSPLIPEKALRDQLMKESEEYRRLAVEHQECDQKLEDLAGKHYLKEDEEILEKTLKKKKLALKDQMYCMVQEHRKQLAGGSC